MLCLYICWTGTSWSACFAHANIFIFKTTRHNINSLKLGSNSFIPRRLSGPSYSTPHPHPNTLNKLTKKDNILVLKWPMSQKNKRSTGGYLSTWGTAHRWNTGFSLSETSNVKCNNIRPISSLKYNAKKSATKCWPMAQKHIHVHAQVHKMYLRGLIRTAPNWNISILTFLEAAF